MSTSTCRSWGHSQQRDRHTSAFLYKGLSPAPPHDPTAEVPREFKGTFPSAQTHWPATCTPTCPAQVLRGSSPSLVSPSAELYPPHLSVPYLGQQPGTGLGMEAKPQLDGCLWPMSSCDEGSVPSQALGLFLSFSIGLCSSPLGLSFPIC